MARNTAIKLAATLSAVWVIATGHGQGVNAQPLDRSVAIRAQNSTVKIVAVTGKWYSKSGSGVLIHPSGYVLTTFDTIGHLHPGVAMPGTLLDKRNRYYITLVSNGSTTKWVARVYLGDAWRNLALLRIVTDTGGRPLGGRKFTYLALSQADPSRLSKVWHLGFEMGGRKPTVVPTMVDGLVRGTENKTIWLNLQRTVASGGVGGPIINGLGRVVGIAGDGGTNGRKGRPRAHPISKIPKAWFQPDAGQLPGARQYGVPHLVRGNTHSVVPLEGGEIHYFSIRDPDAKRVVTNPPQSMWLLDRKGKVIRQGRGELSLPRTKTLGQLLSVRTPTESEPYSIFVDDQLISRLTVPEVLDTPDDEDDILSEVDPDTARKKRFHDGKVSGKIVDAVTGKKVVGARVVVGKPGLDLDTLVTSYLRGKVSERKFQARLASTARSNFVGGFELRSVPTGRALRMGIFAKGYRPAFLNVHVSKRSERAKLGTLRLTH